MKPLKKYAHVSLLILLLLVVIGCGNSNSETAANRSDVIKKIQKVSTPDLASFEPKAREALEKQRADLDALIAAKDTPKSTLGLAYGQMGVQYFAHRFPQPALECLQNAAFLQPDTYRWRYLLGRLHLEEGRTTEAKAAFEKTLTLQAGHAPSNVYLGNLAWDAGDQEQAATHYTQALTKQPKNALAHYGMGRIMLAKEAFPEAARHLQTCLLLQPYARATHALLAKALHGMDQPEAAALQERAVADRRPVLRDPLMDEVINQRFLLLYRIAEALRMNKRDDEALEMYNLAIDLRPDISGPRLGRALSLIRTGKHLKATEQLQDDILAGADAANFKHMLARLLAASPSKDVQNPEKALQILESLNQDHMTPSMVETAAMAMANLEKFQTAIQYQESAIEMAMQAQQPDMLPPLEKNLALYRNKQPCPAPWTENDPIFEMVTYQGESQLSTSPGA